MLNEKKKCTYPSSLIEQLALLADVIRLPVSGCPHPPPPSNIAQQLDSMQGHTGVSKAPWYASPSLQPMVCLYGSFALAHNL